MSARSRVLITEQSIDEPSVEKPIPKQCSYAGRWPFWREGDLAPLSVARGPSHES